MKTCRVLSKITALCLALLMAVSALSTAAFAISSTDKGTIRVSGVEDGVTVSAYQLMDVNYDFDKNQPVDPVYRWVASVQKWVDTYYSVYSDANEFNTKNVDANTAAEFYDKLAAAIKGDSITLTAAGSCTGSGDITDLLMGNYLILIENGMKVYRPSAVNLVPRWNDTSKQWEMTSPATVLVKASEPKLDKSINEDVNDGHPTGQGTYSTTDNITGRDNASIGDVINFDLRADIPQYPANAIAKNYAISDILPAGLTLDFPSIKVYGVAAGGDETLLSEEQLDYAITYFRPSNSEVSTSFTVNFNYDLIKEYKKVHIDYNAVLNENAVIGSVGNPNEAYLDYSNNPYDENSWNSKADKVTVYTYGIDVTKTNKTTPSMLLTGAEFELSKTGEGPALKFKLSSDGVYRLAKAGEDGSTVLAVGGEGAGAMKGKLKLVGLDAGTYYLKETKAPAGYNKISTPIEIIIADSNYDGGVEVEEEDLVNGLVPVTVQNSQGFELPTTGGIGTVLFTAVGVVLMGAGLVMFFLNRKRRKAE